MSKLSVDDVVGIAFHKASLGGYKPEEVDDFIDNVSETIRAYEEENAELSRKLRILAKKIEEYRTEEDSIRSTLLNAQKLASASVREAKHKADRIIRDANSMAEDIVNDAKYKISTQQAKLKMIKKEVVNFRTKLLEIYKEHLRLIDSLPDQDNFSQDKIVNKPATPVNSDDNLTEDELKEIVDRGEANEVLNQRLSRMNKKTAEDDFELSEITSQFTQSSNHISKSFVDEQDTQDDDYVDDDNDKEFHLDAEPKTIRFNAIKFGDNYNIESDKTLDDDSEDEVF